MYCSTITLKSHRVVYTFVALPAAKCCCGRQVNKRQTAPNAAALLSIVGNVVLQKTCKVFGSPDQTGQRAKGSRQ